MKSKKLPYRKDGLEILDSVVLITFMGIVCFLLYLVLRYRTLACASGVIALVLVLLMNHIRLWRFFWQLRFMVCMHKRSFVPLRHCWEMGGAWLEMEGEPPDYTPKEAVLEDMSNWDAE